MLTPRKRILIALKNLLSDRYIESRPEILGTIDAFLECLDQQNFLTRETSIEIIEIT